MSALVGNPEDRFSHNEAHIFSKLFCDSSIDDRCQPSVTDADNIHWEGFLQWHIVKLDSSLCGSSISALNI